ncbi:MAG: hypothetical protein B6U65_03210, partial [Candidatus Wolframiiraptor sp. EX4484-121]
MASAGRYDPLRVEEEVRRFWAENRIIEKVFKLNEGAPIFAFLETELEVEKKLGFKSKKDVEKFGLDRFVEEAQKLVDYYIDHWRKASERLAVWLDYDNAYETRKEYYIEHVWWLIKKAYESGDLV